jgi:hypothetical protein
MSKHRRAPSPALVISLIALFVALGSGAYAASKIGTSDIQSKAVTGAKIAKDAIKSSKVKDEKLKGKDLEDETISSSKLSSGAVRASQLGAITEVSDTTSVAANTLGSKAVSCPAGTKVIGGGFNTDSVAPPDPNARVGLAAENRRTNDGTGWRVKIFAQGDTTELTVYAYCLEDNGS